MGQAVAGCVLWGEWALCSGRERTQGDMQRGPQGRGNLRGVLQTGQLFLVNSSAVRWLCCITNHPTMCGLQQAFICIDRGQAE